MGTRKEFLFRISPGFVYVLRGKGANREGEVKDSRCGMVKRGRKEVGVTVWVNYRWMGWH